MPESALRYASYEDILDLPEYLVGEILFGQLHTHPRKMPIYAGSGVSHLWLVDPDVRTLEVYRIQNDGRWVLLETLKEADAVRQPPFEAVEFSLGMLWV